MQKYQSHIECMLLEQLLPYLLQKTIMIDVYYSPVMNIIMEAISTDRRSKIDPNLKTLKLANFESASHPARGADARNATNGRSASLLYHPITCWMPFLRKL